MCERVFCLCFAYLHRLQHKKPGIEKSEKVNFKEINSNKKVGKKKICVYLHSDDGKFEFIAGIYLFTLLSRKDKKFMKYNPNKIKIRIDTHIYTLTGRVHTLKSTENRENIQRQKIKINNKEWSISH